MDKITSSQNPKIRQVMQLAKSWERKEKQLFVIEGFREISLALRAGYCAEMILLCPGKSHPGILSDILSKVDEALCYEITPALFEKIAYRENSDGVLMVARARWLRPESIRLSENPFVIVLEAIEKPGNLGAVLRTADAAGVDAVMVCDPQTDLFNPNAIRSGIGCLFTNQVVCCTSEEAYQYLKKSGISIYAAELKASRWYHEVNFSKPSAIVMGTEADGLTSFWLNQADERIKIPMKGCIDSLNVSVSTAVLTFEAMRQRGF